MLLADLIQHSGVKFGTSGARGLVSQMTPNLCFAYAQAFWSVAGSGKRVVLGHDLRPSSPEISRACFAAFQNLGIEVIYAGALPTPALAYYGQTLSAPVVIITGSHIPFDRNGIKFYRVEGEITKQDEQAMLSVNLALPESIDLPNLPTIQDAAKHAYIARYLDYFGRDFLAGKTVAIYQHSSVARDLLVELCQSLGAKTLALGRTEVFVPIDTEAVREEDIQQAAIWAQDHCFDILVSTDGDADRPLIADEHGQWLRGDVLGVLSAQFLQADVVVTPVSSNTVVEACCSFKQVLRTQIGSPYVIAAMSEAQGRVMGYEANGGFLLGSPIGDHSKVLAPLATRDAVLPMLALLGLSKQKNCPISQLSSALPARFTYSNRLQNFATEKSQQLIADLLRQPEQIQSKLSADSGDVHLINTTDGLRVSFTSGDIVHLRPSGNAPELRCYAEAQTPERAKLLCERCLNAVN